MSDYKAESACISSTTRASSRRARRDGQAGEDLDERAIVPEGAVPAAPEATPDFCAKLVQVSGDGAGVVNLVRAGDEQCRGRGLREVARYRSLRWRQPGLGPGPSQSLQARTMSATIAP